jgi:hypothetical protein
MLLLLIRTLKSGDQCKVCNTGTLVLCIRKPIFGRPGQSRCLFQCEECGHMFTEVQDDRFVQ